MSHPALLIAAISRLLEPDYPLDAYSYQRECALPGTAMMPDILIFDATHKAVCAVEIGYTRPEKLTAYREVHGIPDVRWYDKAGYLHAGVNRGPLACDARRGLHVDPDDPSWTAGQKLTRALIDQLPSPTKGDRIIFDTETPGLALRVTAGGARVFMFQWWQNGKNHRRRIATHKQISPVAARAIARRLRLALAEGRDIRLPSALSPRLSYGVPANDP